MYISKFGHINNTFKKTISWYVLVKYLHWHASFSSLWFLCDPRTHTTIKKVTVGGPSVLSFLDTKANFNQTGTQMRKLIKIKKKQNGQNPKHQLYEILILLFFFYQCKIFEKLFEIITVALVKHLKQTNNPCFLYQKMPVIRNRKAFCCERFSVLCQEI